MDKVPLAGCSTCKKVVLSLEAPDVMGAYVFRVSSENLPSLKEQVKKNGALLEKDTPEELRYVFKKEGMLLVVNQIATNFMQLVKS